jgi:hypothetical protein
MTRFHALALLLALAPLAACDSDDGGTDTADTSTDTADAAGDVDAGDGSGIDATPDVPADTDPDVAPDVVPDVAPDVAPDASNLPCERQRDCPEGEVCANDVCTVVTCPGDELNWDICQSQLNAIEPDLGRFAVCHDRRCVVGCITDQDCNEGEACTDFGYCRAFDGELTGIDPGEGSAAPLQVGVSNVVWKFPIGVPLGGYGERAAVDDGRYAVSLRASAGAFSGTYIRAVALDTGLRKLVIIRIPTIFTGMALHEGVSRALQDRFGDDWRNSVMISSTHTHSGPCRHWHLPEVAAASLGSFGIGEFSEWFFEWILESTSQAAIEAIEDLQPGRLGWEIVEGFDTDDQIGSDRWNQTPQFDDNRVLLMRVDDAEGVPLAVLFSFAAHGTDNDTDYASGDALGGVEQWLEMELGERFDRFVPTLYLNQNSGSMSPRGDRGGHRFPQTMERIGWAFSDKVLDDILEMETTSDVEIDTYSHRFPVTYDLLGYARDEWYGLGGPPIGGEYHFGGISCSGGASGDQDFSTFASLDDLICVGAIQFLLLNQSPTEFAKTQVMVGRIRTGEREFAFTTTPGEVAMELSWDIAKGMRDTHDIDPLEFWTFGYTNDHLLYLLPTNTRGERPPYPGLNLPHPDNTGSDENGLPLMPGAPDDYPDYAFSYLQGGYEASMSPWGPLMGDYLVTEVTRAWTRLLDRNAEIETPPTLPVWYSQRDPEPFPVDATPTDAVGTVVIQVPATVERLEPIEFGWVGGDPGAEMPQLPLVELQRDEDGTFVTATLPNQQPYTNYEPRFMTRVRRNVDNANYEWIVRWEELKDFPAGSYRFAVSGHYWNGTERVPYSLTSNTFTYAPVEFELAAIEGAVVEMSSPTVLTVDLAYPPARRMNFLDLRRDRGAVEGHFRMRHPWVPIDVADPMLADEDIDSDGVVLTITGPGGPVSTDGLTRGVTTTTRPIGGRPVPVTTFAIEFDAALPSGEYTVNVTATDAWGNVGTTTATLTL